MWIPNASIVSRAPAMNGLADEQDLRQPELHRHWTMRDRAANVRLYRLAAEILAAVEAGVFAPRVGWHCQDCPVRSRCWAWSNRGRASRTGRRSVPGSAAACSLSSASPA
jgi:hypothetical protein